VIVEPRISHIHLLLLQPLHLVEFRFSLQPGFPVLNASLGLLELHDLPDRKRVARDVQLTSRTLPQCILVAPFAPRIALLAASVGEGHVGVRRDVVVVPCRVSGLS